MRYPNLAAEMAQLPNDSNRRWAIDAANITGAAFEEIMAGHDNFAAAEAIALAKYLECELDYLFANTLTIIDTTDERHSGSLYLLEIRLHQLAKIRIFGTWDMDKYRRACSLPSRIESGEAVSLAELRSSISLVEWMIRACGQPERPPKRDTRIEATA